MLPRCVASRRYSWCEQVIGQGLSRTDGPAVIAIVVRLWWVRHGGGVPAREAIAARGTGMPRPVSGIVAGTGRAPARRVMVVPAGPKGGER